MAAPAFALAAVLALIFDVAREIPPSWDCGETPAPDLEERVAAYRSGSDALHALTLLWSLTALALLSLVRQRQRKRAIGLPTVCLAGTLAVATLLALASRGAANVLAIGAVPPAVFLDLIADPLGPQVTGAFAAAVLVAIGVWVGFATREEGRLYAPSTACWALFLLTAGHWLIVSQQGHGPWLC